MNDARVPAHLSPAMAIGTSVPHDDTYGTHRRASTLGVKGIAQASNPREAYRTTRRPGTMNLRVLQCIPSMMGGGAERQFCYLCEGLVRRGHSVDAVYLYDGPNTPRLLATGARVHRLDARGSFDARALLRLRDIARESGAMLIQTWLRRMDVWGSVAARMLGLPWFFAERSQHKPQRWSVDDLAFHAMVRMSSAVVANSHTAAENWRRSLGQGRTVEVVENALPLVEIDATSAAETRELGIAPGAPVVLYAGRFNAGKNVMRLARSLAEVIGLRPDVRAVCCGEGGELEAFRALVASMGMQGKIVTPGYRADLWEWMKASTVFVSPSLAEGRPNVVMEAMAASVPMVLSDIEPHREFVRSQESLWFEPDDGEAMTRAILRAFDDRPGAELRARRARTSVERYSIDALAAGYERLYVGALRSG